MAKFQSRPFDDTDWSAFAGCESDNPLINDQDEERIVIMDGLVVCVFNTTGDLADELGATLPSLEVADEVAALCTTVSEATLAWLFRD